MLDSIVGATGTVLFSEIFICTLASLGAGVVIALVYMYKNTYSKNFVITLALLPVMVQSVIMVVNGNVGAGVAVMGAFSLVRFRSVPGSAKEIACIFFSMAVGLTTGMGLIFYAVLFTVIVSVILLLYTSLHFGEKPSTTKTLLVIIPEDLDYTSLFDDLFDKYTKKVELEKVKTIDLGSLFQLNYTITLKDLKQEKEFIDEIRKRNGNLNISCGRLAVVRDEL